MIIEMNGRTIFLFVIPGIVLQLLTDLGFVFLRFISLLFEPRQLFSYCLPFDTQAKNGHVFAVFKSKVILTFWPQE